MYHWAAKYLVLARERSTKAENTQRYILKTSEELSLTK